MFKRLRARMWERLTRKKGVIAWGRDSYIRFYPNPGFGTVIPWTEYRWALSWYGGFEVFHRVFIPANPEKGRPADTHIWIREFSIFSRVQRPRCWLLRRHGIT